VRPTRLLGLERIRPRDRGLVGGKALGCAALRRLGLRVPAGFVVTTGAWAAFLGGAGEADALDELSEPAWDDAGLARRCAARQERLRRGSLPPLLASRVRARLADLRGPFAVRSSGTAEDSARSSFAGVYESHLDVPADGVLAAVRACWASALSHVAVVHQLQHDLDPRRGGMAVLVQEMVGADWAGALFTREPSGARPEEAVLAFVRGRGDRLMEGAEGGASLRLDRESGRPLGGERGDLPGWIPARLLAIGRRVEEALGHPQDLEWAVRGEELFLLQTRPVTTIEPLRDPPVTWTRELTEERFPGPISPLGWSALLTVGDVNNRTLRKRFGLTARHPEDIARVIGHYVYTNEGFFELGAMRVDPLRQARFFASYCREGLDALRHLPDAAASRTPFGPRWLALSRLFRAFVLPHAREIERDWSRHLDAVVAEIDAFNDVDVAALSLRELWEARLAIQPAADRFMEPDLAIYVVKTACSAVVERLGEALRGRRDPAFLTDLTAGVWNRTLDLNLELAELAAAVRGEPALRADLEGERYEAALERLRADPTAGPGALFARFVARNGHSTSSWDMRQPTWGEEPRQILALLRSATRAGPRTGVAERRAAQVARYRAARAAARRALRRAPWMRDFFDEVLRTLRTFMAIDEEHHFFVSRLYRPTRRIFAELGRRLVAGRVIARPEDVYFLTLEEIRAALAQRVPHTRRYLVAARRASFERAAARRPPERLRNQTPLPARGAEDAPPPRSDGALQGVGASAGVAEGAVRVVLRPEDASAFQAGEVLVTASPNPVWTPLYAVASALVTATGSLLSHGVVSAREYHLPAVVEVADVTNRLKTGQRVRVDGTRGTVTPELP